jgi:endonuclease YncB( thermonuclease family)
MKKNTEKLLLLLLILLAASLPPAFAQEFSGRVIKVSDGDTITVLDRKVPRKVRLSGIDCPEKSQAFGRRAREFTASRVFGKEVKVISSGHDRYGRIIGEVTLPDGQNLNDLLLANGYAWWYERYSSDKERHELQDNARKLKRGLWSDREPSAPWDYRKTR